MHLFNKLAVSQLPHCMDHQGIYSMISLNFKGIKFDTWSECQENLFSLITDEFRRHKYLLKGATLDLLEKNDYRFLVSRTLN